MCKCRRHVKRMIGRRTRRSAASSVCILTPCLCHRPRACHPEQPLTLLTHLSTSYALLRLQKSSTKLNQTSIEANLHHLTGLYLHCICLLLALRPRAPAHPAHLILEEEDGRALDLLHLSRTPSRAGVGARPAQMARVPVRHRPAHLLPHPRPTRNGILYARVDARGQCHPSPI